MHKIITGGQMRMAAIRPASLEAPIGSEDTSNLADVVEDEKADNPYEQLEEKGVSGMLQEMVARAERARGECGARPLRVGWEATQDPGRNWCGSWRYARACSPDRDERIEKTARKG